MTTTESTSTGAAPTSRPDLRSVLTASVFIAVIAGLFLAGRIMPAPTVLASERRAPAQLPALTVDSVLSAQFMKGVENYASDNFPFRETFRTVHAASVLGLFAQTDKSGLTTGDAGICRFEPVNLASVEMAGDKIARVAAGLNGLNLYYAVVPDKSLFAGRHLPGAGPGQAEAILAARLGGLTPIPLGAALTADSFYRTDLHWDQTKLRPVVDALGAAMGFRADLGGLTPQSAGSFTGAYGGQWALPVPPDALTYLANPNLTATYLNPATQAMDPGPVYDPAAITAVDPYNVFLGGPQPLVVLTNSAATTDRELYLFRDSFGSSLAPLLAGAYAKVTLIDLRYINARLLDRFVDFRPGSDVLFLYSSQILNNASTLQVS